MAYVNRKTELKQGEFVEVWMDKSDIFSIPFESDKVLVHIAIGKHDAITLIKKCADFLDDDGNTHMNLNVGGYLREINVLSKNSSSTLGEDS